jgi:peptidylprolyl isomerase
MKSMFQIIAAVACALALTACGGSKSSTATTPAVVQPALKLTDTVVGTGTTAAIGDLVVISFNGWLYDASKSDFKGAKVESSVDTGKLAPPFTLGVGSVITGWDQSIVGMKVGGKRTAVLPANLVYGATAHLAQPTAANGTTYSPIPANSAIVYDFELVSVIKATVPVVVPPPTDLVYLDTTVGTGTAPTATSSITVNYKLYLYDGTRADLRSALIETNGTTPISFNLANVIPGWTQGIAGRAAVPATSTTAAISAIPAMLPGGKRTLTVPPGLAYGAFAQLDSAGNVKIPALSTLIFDIELISVP